MTENDLLLMIGLSQIGVTEIKGDEHNPVILQYFKDIGHSWVKEDETHWCSAFMNWVAHHAKCEKSKKLNARSWMEIGEAVDFDNYQEGDVCVFWRESQTSWKGHVSMYIGEDEDQIYCLGGNQNNQVNISPYKKSRLLSVRRLSFTG